MKLKERLSHFWNDTLGVDCPDEINILDSGRPEDEELKKSLARVDELEKKFKVSSSSSSKAGKGLNIEVEADTSKAIEKAKQKTAKQKESDNREER